MTDIEQWEQQLHQQLAEIHSHSGRLTQKAAELRGHGEVRGVLVEVDTAGEITSLQIAPAAMKWTHSQLTSAVLDCHRRARADVKSKVERLLRKADPRIREQAKLLVADSSPVADRPRQPVDEATILEADDAYYEHRNRHGGWTAR
ncbi:hypothetical protein [Nocardia sp. NPDC050175]|uniref:hypothetical protein n=1 Tax=Nocardia sp. NPDC050175 TaxID=3364317 RepID=UPI00379533BA